MSASSDLFEKLVADKINSIKGITASRPKVSVKYADVRIDTYKGIKLATPVWVEVKMNHTDNLGNTRVFYDGTNWDGARDPGAGLDPIKEFACEQLTKSISIQKWIKDLGKLAGIKKPKIPTTKGGLKDPDAIPLDVMRSYFRSRPSQYILTQDNVNLGELVTKHYLNAKAEPAHYIQAGEDFYMIGNLNPLKLPSNIPKLAGYGQFKMRVSLRTEFYEIQPEIKITEFSPKSSPYSVIPGNSSKKKNPFGGT